MPCFWGYFMTLSKIWWRWSIIFSFHLKKFKFQKTCPRGFLWLQSVDKILRFCNWYGLWYLINSEQNVSDARFLCKQQYYVHILWKQPFWYPSDCNWTIIVAQTCLKIWANWIFFYNFLIPWWILKKYIVNFHHFVMYYEARKDKEPVWSKKWSITA